MPSVSNRDIEQYYFEMFRKNYPLPAGRVEYGDKPDVIIHGDTTIGIEITNFFLEEGTVPSSEQVQKKARHDAVAKAHRLYQSRHGGKFELTMAFDRRVPSRSERRRGADRCHRSHEQESMYNARFYDIFDLANIRNKSLDAGRTPSVQS